MKCSNCGLENGDVKFCANCGTELQNQNSTYVSDISDSDLVYGSELSGNPVACYLNTAFSDVLVLIMAILMSVNCLFYVIDQCLPQIFILLYTIFLWCIYSAARNNKISEKNINTIKGTLTVEYVIGYVASGILILAGVLFALLFIAVGNNPLVFEEIIAVLEEVPELAQHDLTREWFVIAAIVLLLVFVIVGVATLLINLLIRRKITRFAEELSDSALYGNFRIKNVSKVSGCLFAFGILLSIAATSSLFSEEFLLAVATAAQAAATIIGSIWVKKYLAAYDSANLFAPQTEQLN